MSASRVRLTELLPGPRVSPRPHWICVVTRLAYTRRHQTLIIGLVGVECPYQTIFDYLSALHELLYGLRRLQQLAPEVLYLVSP